jgi:hypothetical protein
MTTNTKTTTCKAFQSELPDLVLTPNAKPSLAAVAHMRECPPCAEEYISFQATFSALSDWTTPEPTPYFDQKLAVRIREEQAAPKMSWIEAFRTRLLLNSSRHLRPVMVSAFALILVASGGGIAGINYANLPVQPSATVNDLQILENNEQAFHQLDELQQEEEANPQQDAHPAGADSDNAPVAPPAT